MKLPFYKILFFFAIVVIVICIALFNPPITRTIASTNSTIVKTVAAILISSALFLFLLAKQVKMANNLTLMVSIAIIATAIFIWVGKLYLDVIENNTCFCNNSKILIGAELTFDSDSTYTCQQLLSQRGCNPEGIWKPESFEYAETKIKNFYLLSYPLLVLSLISISQCIFILTPIKILLMRLFTKKVSCKRFYETKSRTIDITGLKTGVPQKFDLGVASFKINTKYQDASEKLKTLDLLQYGLCNDINGVSDLKQRDKLLKKIIDTKTKMLEIVLEISSDTKETQ